MPASRKNRSVQGARRAACRIKRSCSESVLPSAYGEGEVLAVMLTLDSNTHRRRTAQPSPHIATPAYCDVVSSKAVRHHKLRRVPPSSPPRLGRLQTPKPCRRLSKLL